MRQPQIGRPDYAVACYNRRAMNRAINDKQDRIQSLCEEHGVRTLYVFGSAVDGSFDVDDSDVDFLVEFLPMEPGDLAAAYFGLLEGLEALFERRIDLVTYRSIENPYFRQAIDAQKVSVYAAA